MTAPREKQNGTNANNLKDYIKNSRNNLVDRIKNQKELSINDLEALVGQIDTERVYFIYVENKVYMLSTASQSLYDELDQITQSFKYNP